MTKLVRLRPKHGVLRLMYRHNYYICCLGVAHAISGDLPNSINELNQALEIEPKRLDALFNRALVYQTIKSNDAAKADWQQFLAIDNTSQWADEARKKLAELN